MKVRKVERKNEPAYPTKRRFPGYGTAIGAAVIGLGTVVAASRTPGRVAVETRLSGDIAIDPPEKSATNTTFTVGLPRFESSDRTPSNRVASAASSNLTYRIQEGDSLWKIAKRLLGEGDRWREIAKMNPDLDAESLRVGSLILVPVVAAGKASATNAPSQSPEEPRLLGVVAPPRK